MKPIKHHYFMYTILINKYTLILCMLMFISLTTRAFEIKESLKESTSSNFVFGLKAYLTAGKDDAEGDGWLRLTQDTAWTKGYALMKKAFPSKLGLLIDFDFMIWRTKSGTGGADGISVFLYDAKTTDASFHIGAFGGSLGYAQRHVGTNTTPGVSNGYLGLGIDVLGNYANPTEGRIGGPGWYSNAISIRGPESSNYLWLAGAKTNTQLQIGEFVTRPTANDDYRHVQIEISPTSTGGANQYTVTVRLQTSKTGTLQTIIEPFTIPYNAPDSLKLGLSASTGTQFNRHDVRNIQIATLNGVRVRKTVDKSLATVNDELTYTIEMLNQGDIQSNGIKLSDVFSQPSSVQVNSVIFDNGGNIANTATNYSNNDLSNVIVNLAPYGESKLTIKAKIINYPTNGVLSNTAVLDIGSTGLQDPDLTNNTSTISTGVLTGNERITLVKEVVDNKSYQLGDIVQYKFTVNNPGDTPLTNVILTDNKLSSTAVLIGGDANRNSILDPGESWIYSGSYSIKQADVDFGKFVNQAVVTSLVKGSFAISDTSGITVNDNEPTVILINSTSKITLLKTVETTGTISLGTTIRYLFAVNNPGNTILSNIVLTDAKLSSLSYKAGDINLNGKIDVGETWYYTGEYVVTQADIDLNQISNTATIKANDPSGSLVNDISGTTADNDTPTVITINGISQIAISKVITNQGPFKISDQINYLFKVSNTGNTVLSNVVITDNKLLNAITYINGDTDNDQLLDVSETWNYSSNYIVKQADVDSGFVKNLATVTAFDPQINKVEDVSGPTIYENKETLTSLPQLPKIALIKTVHNTGTFRLGDVIKYDFTVANIGNVTLKMDSISDLKLGKSSITYQAGDINTNNLLDVGEIWTYNALYSVIQADVDSGRVLNSAIVYAVDPQNTIITDISGSTTINDSPTITPIIQNPKIALLKSVSSNGQYLLGNRIKYSLEVINTGSVSLTNITLTDSKITDNIVLETTDQNGQLDVGESWSYSGTYTVTQADVDAGYVLNTATVIAKDSKGNTVSDISGSAINNNNPTQTAVIQSDKIALVKQVTSEGPYKIGSQIEYTFQVYNIGNTTLTQPIISDSKLNIAANYQSGDSNTNQKLEVSESWIFTGYYTVTSQDVQKGSISNSAIVTAYNTQGKQVKDSSGITVADNLPTITLINQAPVANPDSVITKMNIAIIIEILNNDLSGNGNLDTDSITIITQPEHGTLTINSDGTITYTPNDNYVGTDQFTYSVKDINGNVSNTTTVKIKILENQLVIPNVFTPNGDGKNETFHILGLDSYTGVELLIYSRWGAEVYNNLSYQNNWDGNGLNDGTYYYVLKLKRGDNATIYSGWILLKR